MPWPSWVFWRQKPQEDRMQEDDTKSSPLLPKDESPPVLPSSKKTPWSDNLNRTDLTHYTTPQTLTISAITTLTTLALLRLYKTHLRRIPTTQHLKPDTYRKHSLYGYVTRVGDGDNFHLFHTPGGRWLGWGWFPGRTVQGMGGKEVRGRTVKVRIAGVDAPEGAHFGKQPQPYAQEALEWLQSYILHRYVRVYPLRQDQYERVVAAVYSRRWIFFRSDVSLEMIKRGWATVYEAKVFAEFNGKEEEYRKAEERARGNRIGMWQQPGLVGRLLGKKKTVETPREYKTRTAKEEKEKG